MPYDFDIVKLKKITKSICMSTKRLNQRKRRTWEVTQQFLLMQEKVHACVKFWGNLKGERVESMVT